MSALDMFEACRRNGLLPRWFVLEIFEGYRRAGFLPIWFFDQSVDSFADYARDHDVNFLPKDLIVGAYILVLDGDTWKCAVFCKYADDDKTHVLAGVLSEATKKVFDTWCYGKETAPKLQWR